MERRIALTLRLIGGLTTAEIARAFLVPEDSGEEWKRAVCDEALRLGRVLVQLLTGESEVHALLALMELASRTAARLGSNGKAVLLPDQDRSLGDDAQIQRGMNSLEHAQRLGGEVK